MDRHRGRLPERLLRLQAGVVSRGQLLEWGLDDHDLRRLRRRRELNLVHDGVYVDHTGPLTWQQRAWAAVLFAWPAALCDESAMRAADGPARRGHRDDGPVHVAVDMERRVRGREGLIVHRRANLTDRVQWNASPPRMRIEDAVLDLAVAAPGELRTVATLADAVQSRRTTAARLLAALGARERVAGRLFIESVLHDIADGTCSVLEHAYLTRVERPHGLPRPERQLSPAGLRVFRDVDYKAYGLVVELDGRLFHDTAAAHDADLERDLDAAVLDDGTTVRLGWGQVLARPCATAAKVAALLQRRGWRGSLRRCRDCPPDPLRQL